MSNFHTPTTRHPYALTLALLIVAEKQQRKYADGTFEEAVYEVLQKALDLTGWSESKRADLYARLAESLQAADGVIDTERKINVALWATERTL